MNDHGLVTLGDGCICDMKFITAKKLDMFDIGTCDHGILIGGTCPA